MWALCGLKCGMATRVQHGDTGPWFAELSQDLMSDPDVAKTLDKVCRSSLAIVPAADFAAITVRQRRGKLETQAYTDQAALRCDELQYSLGEGPCMDAALEDESFLVVSTGDDSRWPRWGPAVAELGVHSLIGVQLPAAVIDPDHDPLGAVNIYARRINAFNESDLARAKVFAVHAGNALTAARQVSTLSQAVEARHQVGVAQGVLMRRYGIGLDQTFELLQRYSSHTNVKLRDVAAIVVEQGQLPISYEEFSPPGPESVAAE